MPRSPPCARRGRFLVESHSLRIVPSAFLLDRARNATRPQVFLGIADPIYNLADPRWRRRCSPPPLPSRREPNAITRQLLELPRLPASSIEVSAGGARLAGRLGAGTDRPRRQPRADRPGSRVPSVRGSLCHSRAAVRRGPRRQSSWLWASTGTAFPTSTRPPRWRPGGSIFPWSYSVPAVRVGATSFRGAGQMGLPRAWLISGTRSVIASHWPTADESGAIFAPLYRELGRPAEVLSSRALCPGTPGRAARDDRGRRLAVRAPLLGGVLCCGKGLKRMLTVAPLWSEIRHGG